MRSLVVLALAAALTGCLAPAADQGQQGATYRVSGSFTREFDDADGRDLDERLAPWIDEILIMESFPAQYSFGGLGAEDCAAVRDVLLARPYVATVSECRAEAPPAADPDAPATSAGG